MRADGLEIGQATVPTIEKNVARLKATVFGLLKQVAEVVVLGRTIHRLVKQPIVTGDGVCSITPQ